MTVLLPSIPKLAGQIYEELLTQTTAQGLMSNLGSGRQALYKNLNGPYRPLRRVCRNGELPEVKHFAGIFQRQFHTCMSPCNKALIATPKKAASNIHHAKNRSSASLIPLHPVLRYSKKRMKTLKPPKAQGPVSMMSQQRSTKVTSNSSCRNLVSGAKREATWSGF